MNGLGCEKRRSPQGQSHCECTWEHHTVKGQPAPLITVTVFSIIHLRALWCTWQQNRKERKKVACHSGVSYMMIDWFQSVPSTPSAERRRSLHQYSIPSTPHPTHLLSIFMPSFIFITGYTERIRTLCVHFWRSLFEMKRWRSAVAIPTADDLFLCVHGWKCNGTSSITVLVFFLFFFLS